MGLTNPGRALGRFSLLLISLTLSTLSGIPPFSMNFFFLAKAALAYLPTALSVAPRPLFPSQQAQYAQVFLLKPTVLCKLFVGFGNTNKSAASLLFSSYLTLVLSSPPCPFFHLFFISNSREEKWICFIRPQWVPGHSFLPGNDAADKLARRGTLLAPSAIPCSLSPLISRMHPCLFSDWRRTVSSKFFDAQVPSISTDELVLPHHARYVLSRLRCNGHSLLLSSYLFRIGKIENPSCSACGHLFQNTSHLILTVQLRTLCAAHFLATLCLFTTSGPGPGELSSFWGSMVFCHAPIPRKRSGNNNNNNASSNYILSVF